MCGQNPDWRTAARGIAEGEPCHEISGAYRFGDVPAASCVAGHRGGLPDGGTRFDHDEKATLRSRLNRAKEGRIEDCGAFRREAAVPTAETPGRFLQSRESSFFFTGMLFLCLVDADFFDTERFMQNDGAEWDGFPPQEESRRKITTHTAPWLEHPRGALGEERSEILAAGERAPGLFTFTAPTGSGKTLSSMAFALAHAEANGLRRVINVTPYCSIIEQTQAVFERVFGGAASSRTTRTSNI